VFDIRKWDVWEATHSLLNNYTRFQSADLAEKAVTLLFQTLTWELKRVCIEGEYDNQSLKRLMKRRDQFLSTANSIIRDGAAGVENAYLCLCDMLIFFNWKVAADADVSDPLIQALPVKLDQETSNRVLSFVMDNVFVESTDPDQAMEVDSAGVGGSRGLHPDVYMQSQMTDKRRNLLGQYCKLIMHGVLPVIEAASVFTHYARVSKFDC